MVTRQQQYGAMYEYKPKTIVVMPPINQTNFAEAKDYFYTPMSLDVYKRQALNRLCSPLRLKYRVMRLPTQDLPSQSQPTMKISLK